MGCSCRLCLMSAIVMQLHLLAKQSPYPARVVLHKGCSIAVMLEIFIVINRVNISHKGCGMENPIKCMYWVVQPPYDSGSELWPSPLILIFCSVFNKSLGASRKWKEALTDMNPISILLFLFCCYSSGVSDLFVLSATLSWSQMSLSDLLLCLWALSQLPSSVRFRRTLLSLISDNNLL